MNSVISPDRMPRKVADDAIITTCTAHIVNITATVNFRGACLSGRPSMPIFSLDFVNAIYQHKAPIAPV